jgi:2-iminoacetate synthase
MDTRDTINPAGMLSGVEAAVRAAAAPDRQRLDDILGRAAGLEGVTLGDAASLLKIEDREDAARLFRAAGRVKERVFGPRVVLFAPLYLSNHCANDCLYCGFRRSSEVAARRALSVDEAVEQARHLSSRGFKRILLVAGEHPAYSGVEYLEAAASAIYSETDIRILHVNCAPLATDGFRRLKAAGYGVYQCFQETYHRDTYARVHPSGKKRDYGFRLEAMDRALEAGFGDVGIGALLGLYDYAFDALAAIAHSRRLEERFGAAAHTISVPRLRHAEGAALTEPPYPVTGFEFKKIVAVYRLCVPYAGVVVSTREPASLREEALDCGASQISAGSSTEPGGYGPGEHSTAQFDVTDLRGLPEMMAVIARKGLLPSLCTSCYRSGRQGEEFRELASTGAMREFCTPNAILSLREFMRDNPDEGLNGLLERTVERFSGEVDEPLRRDLMDKLGRTARGERDLHY